MQHKVAFHQGFINLKGLKYVIITEYIYMQMMTIMWLRIISLKLQQMPTTNIQKFQTIVNMY